MRAVFERQDTLPLIAEVFREFGYEGATFSRITERTGISKGSLYHFFPDGKEEMAAHVLAHIDAWFEAHVFTPLARDEPREAVAQMWRAVLDYFHSGRRICLVGVFAMDETRDVFADAIKGYFQRWIKALKQALVRAGVGRARAQDLAEECVAGIQGGLVISRATGEAAQFVRTVRRLAARVDDELSG